MVKDNVKGKKGPGQKHLHSRISYLYQAATYLASAQHRPESLTQATKRDAELRAEPSNLEKAISDLQTEYSIDSRKTDTPDEVSCAKSSKPSPLSRVYINHLKAVSLKSQIRLAPDIKHSICKRCDILLVPGATSTSCLENKSRGGSKPWADVLVVTCNSCGTAKRFPVGARRQPRRPDRARQEEASAT